MLTDAFFLTAVPHVSIFALQCFCTAGCNLLATSGDGKPSPAPLVITDTSFQPRQLWSRLWASA